MFEWLFPKRTRKPAPMLRDMTFAEIVRIAKKAPKPKRGPRESAETLAQKHLQWCREMNPTLTSNVVRTTQHVGISNYKPLSAAKLAQRDARILARRRRARS